MIGIIATEKKITCSNESGVIVVDDVFQSDVVVEMRRWLCAQEYSKEYSLDGGAMVTEHEFYKADTEEQFYRLSVLKNISRKKFTEMEGRPVDFDDIFGSDSFRRYVGQLANQNLGLVAYLSRVMEQGDFISSHIDDKQNRVLAFVFYLSGLDEKDDGGQLSIHCDDRVRSIEPKFNRLVLWNAQEKIIHSVAEVVGKNVKRISIGGWFDDPVI